MPFQIGDNNPKWKGDNVGYSGIHNWFSKYYPKPSKCEKCKESKSLELANISGRYDRKSESYKYLCKSCHSKFDNKVSLLKDYAIRKDTSRYRCVACGSDKTRIRKENNRPIWCRLEGKPLCTRCARHKRWVELGK